MMIYQVINLIIPIRPRGRKEAQEVRRKNIFLK
jgi:hypothetical protein